jgi:flagellar biosynthesis chaperone FliJ
MRRFHFTLQPALDAKTAREQAAAVRVSIAERDCRDARDRLKVLQEHRAAQAATMACDATKGGAGHGEGLRFMERLGGAVTAQARRVTNLDERLENAKYWRNCGKASWNPGGRITSARSSTRWMDSRRAAT